MKHLEFRTYRWQNGHHSGNFCCRVWAKIKNSCFIIQELRPYVTPRRASSSYRLQVHSFIMHALKLKHRIPSHELSYAWLKRMDNEERGQREAHCQKEVESSKGEARHINLLEQVLSFKNGKRTYVQSLVGNTVIPCPTHKKKFSSSPQHFTSNDHNLKVAPPLRIFSHEQWQQHLQSSTKDNLLSGSTVLLVVHHLHVLQ